MGREVGATKEVAPEKPDDGTTKTRKRRRTELDTAYAENEALRAQVKALQEGKAEDPIALLAKMIEERRDRTVAPPAPVAEKKAELSTLEKMKAYGLMSWNVKMWPTAAQIKHVRDRMKEDKSSAPFIARDIRSAIWWPESTTSLVESIKENRQCLHHCFSR